MIGEKPMEEQEIAHDADGRAQADRRTAAVSAAPIA